MTNEKFKLSGKTQDNDFTITGNRESLKWLFAILLNSDNVVLDTEQNENTDFVPTKDESKWIYGINHAAKRGKL